MCYERDGAQSADTAKLPRPSPPAMPQPVDLPAERDNEVAAVLRLARVGYEGQPLENARVEFTKASTGKIDFCEVQQGATAREVGRG
jgi:hypothetical protein